MVRAVFFDFYSVWTPDKFGYYLALAQQTSPELGKQMYDMLERYYHGQVDIEYVSDTFRVRLGHPDLGLSQFKLDESNIAPDIVNFMRDLHGHFLKIGILANLGNQEYQLLSQFNERNQVFEVIASPLSLQSSSSLLSKEVFSLALQAIGEPPQSCLLVSGNPYYLAFAASLDLATLQFEGLPQLEQAISTILSSEQPPAA